MAAPASWDEFAGNVVAVPTENCWDSELDGIVVRDDAIRNRVNQFKKDNRLLELAREISGDQEWPPADREAAQQLEASGQLEQALLERLRTAEFGVREYQILEVGKSNAAFHYLGCAKIMACIGRTFAEAMPLEHRNAK
jgi:hypothetical protein